MVNGANMVNGAEVTDYKIHGYINVLKVSLQKTFPQATW